MDLVADNVVAYLVERGLLPSERALGAGTVVRDVSRRNKDFRVSTPDAGFMVKQVRTANAEDILMLRREASCYEMARSDEELSRLMPALLSYDPSANILVTRLASDAESLADRNRRGGDLLPALGEKLGNAIGRHHARPASSFERGNLMEPFRRRVPLILNLGETAREEWHHFGPIAPRLSELVRQRPNLLRMLDAFRAQWRWDCLMHGDVSWENVIVTSATTQAPDLLIVDWEMADIGDPGWDVGVVLRSFLPAWVLDGQPRRGQQGDEAGSRRPPIQAVRALTLAFWNGYVRARGFDVAQSQLELERGMRFAALQIVFAALEISRHLRPEHLSSAMSSVGVALSLFQSPQVPARNLLDG